MKVFFMFILVFLLQGCSFKTLPNLDTKALEGALNSIDMSINTSEAKSFSLLAIKHAHDLALSYELVRPPLFHNWLVNIGAKKRGLCWHFAFDMLDMALKQKYKSFDFYIVGANINDYFEEHNALLVTCQGCEVSKGVIIDAWRNSGELFFSKINDDPDYSWSQRGGVRNAR